MCDIYVVVHIATTCDESTTYVTKDSTELIEFTWSVVDATTLAQLHQETVFARPVNTPITPYCSQLHRISWEHVRNAGSFKDAITKFDNYIQQNVIQENKEFSLVTFDLRKLRVQLPREARDKSVVLPPYLQHPRVFDLLTEYSKWQTTHPESLSYSASSLSNIITALEVEVDNIDDVVMCDTSSTSTPSSTPPPGSTSSSSKVEGTIIGIETETKALATVDVFSNLLIQLVKKSIPLDEHATVLTKPYDAAQDTRVFLAERSKILYLSNLPSDTTQSELESWFTQYGGRPVAFWTLKNTSNGEIKNGVSVNNNKPKSNTGFAVFATHEEASEALSMNGRVLNDSAVEVQASSTTVLDKANDLLTPFPPSKNRPRPGDWTCPSCGFSNFQRRTHCFRCSFPVSSAAAIQESMYSSNNNSLGNRRNNTNNTNNSGSSTNNNSSNSYNNSNSSNLIHSNNNNGQSNDKVSLNSTVVNAAAILNNHNINSNPYHDNSQQQSAPNYHSQGSHSNNQMYHSGSNNNNINNLNVHSNTHNNHNSRSHFGNNVPFRAGDWKCDMCIYHNFAKNLYCLKCGAAKPAMSNNNHQNNAIHSVNSTAAAIAAATASGQPLNLSNGFMNLQQPQPHHAYGSSNNQSRQNSVGSGNSHYSNQNNNNQGSKGHQYHYNNSSLRGSGNGTPQPQSMPQQLMVIQQQQHQIQQSQQQHKYSLSATNSPGVYSNYNNQQPMNSGYYNKNSISHSGQGSSNNDPNKGVNPSFNMLSNQINSLSLNN